MIPTGEQAFKFSADSSALTCAPYPNRFWRFRFKVSGELPLLHVKISDQKIHSVLELVDGIPLPNVDSLPSTPTLKVRLVQTVRLAAKH